MPTKTQATRIALLERENVRLKLLIGRLAEWHNLPAGPLEAAPAEGMTLAIQFPNGTIRWPLDMRYVLGIWHQFSGDQNSEVLTLEQEELILNQLICGHMVHTIHTYFKTNEEEKTDEAGG